MLTWAICKHCQTSVSHHDAEKHLTECENYKESLKMTDTTAPILEQAVEAATETLASPNPITVIQDLELATKLVAEFKAKLAGMHPSIMNIIKALL